MDRMKVVTGYIDIPGHPRGANDYRALGAQLLDADLGCEVCVFDDPEQTVQGTWMNQYVHGMSGLTHSVADNPEKNTEAYHCVQHQKFAWLSAAATLEPADVYVWIDYGILHVPGVTVPVIRKFLSRAGDYGQAVLMPGCWPKYPDVPTAIPCWRFCGGLISVPGPLMKSFVRLATGVASRHVAETKNLEWEVNTLARLELIDQIPIHWYKADHDQTMFTGAP